MDYKVKYENWISSEYLCSEGVAELKKISEDDEAIKDAFGAELEFGTAGMRGIIGYGTNRMNVYTVRRATKGLADFIKSKGKAAMQRGVAISYDTRNKSELFARAAAGVLLYNDITETRSDAFLRGEKPERFRGYNDNREPQPEGV